MEIKELYAGVKRKMLNICNVLFGFVSGGLTHPEVSTEKVVLPFLFSPKTRTRRLLNRSAYGKARKLRNQQQKASRARNR